MSLFFSKDRNIAKETRDKSTKTDVEAAICKSNEKSLTNTYSLKVLKYSCVLATIIFFEISSTATQGATSVVHMENPNVLNSNVT